MTRRRLVWFAAALAVPLALALALLGADVLSVPRDMDVDDARFEAAPRVKRALWDDVGFLPARPGERLLDARDDIVSRKTVALYALIDPSRVHITTPEQDALRGRAQLDVTLRSREGGPPQRRSLFLNLLGVLTLGRFSTSGPEQTQILTRAQGAFQNAVEVDPDNDDAKRNLEILLRRPEAAQLPPNDPSQGGAQGRVSGQGRSGSGY